MFILKLQEINFEGRKMKAFVGLLNNYSSAAELLLLMVERVKNNKLHFEDESTTSSNIVETAKLWSLYLNKINIQSKSNAQTLYVTKNTKLGILAYNTLPAYTSIVMGLINSCFLFMLPVVWNKTDMLNLVGSSRIELILVDNDYLIENHVTVQELEESSQASVIVLPKNFKEMKNLISTQELSLNNIKDFKAPAKVELADGWVVVFTSGSTAQPKGVVHYNLAGLLFIGSLSWLRWVMGEYGTNISYTPNSYMGGLCQLFDSLTVPEDKVILRKYNKKKYCEAIQKYRVQNINLTPFFFYDIKEYVLKEKIDYSSIKTVAVFGQMINFYKFRKEVDLLSPSIKVAQVYGGAEFGVIAACTDSDYKKYPGRNFVGKILTLTGVEFKLIDTHIDPETKHEVGVICTRSFNNLKGYYNDPENTKNSFMDDYYITGDVGYVDANNYLYLVDRCKDTIIHKGYNIHSGELENAVNSCVGEGMKMKGIQVICIRELHDKYGEIPVVVFANESTDTGAEADEEEEQGKRLLEMSNSKLSLFKKIFKFYKIDNMPLVNTSLKMDKKVVRTYLDNNHTMKKLRLVAKIDDNLL